MKKFIKNIFYLSMILILFNACQSVKDGLTGKKQSNTDEFLIEKKNPLVLPPEFSDLPKPGELNKDSKNNNEENSLENIFSNNDLSTKKNSDNNPSDSSLEQSILEKIKKN